MDPTTAWIIIVVAGLAALALGVVLVRRWNRENRRRYPNRVTSRRFAINRERRTNEP